MEARATIDRTGISRLFVGAVLVIVAVGLGIMAAYLAAGLSGAASVTQHNAAPGTVLRQDNPSQAEQAPAVNLAPDSIDDGIAPGTVLVPAPEGFQPLPRTGGILTE
jgi:hypothetical protein